MPHSSYNERRNRKRGQFSQNSVRSGPRPSQVIGVAGAVIIIVLILLVVGASTKSSAAKVVTSAADGAVHIPLTNIRDGHIRFYEYRATNKKAVRFFVVKSSDGVYRVAADACTRCYRAKLGYQQQGDELVCNKCGRHFRSTDVNVITGICSPDGIPRTIQGNNLLIAVTDLDASARLF